MANQICKTCLITFYVKPFHLKKGWGKFCSKKCQFLGMRKGKNVNCDWCGKTVYKSLQRLGLSKSGKYFCNRSCQTNWRNKIFSGERSANWVNGISVYRHKLLESGAKVECFLCKITDKRLLNAHHIDHLRINNNLNNLVWLCLNCHYLVHHSSEFDQKVRKYKQNL